MKIKLRDDIAETYIRENTDYKTNEYYGEDIIEIRLWELSGEVVEVDTNYIPLNEYNIKPVNHVTEQISRIPEEWVEAIFDDIRDTPHICNKCNVVFYGLDQCEFCKD